MKTEVEKIKENSNYLRGTIKESLIDEITGNLSPDDQTLIKFHGSYVQFDRDTESERKKQKLEPLYSFMIRIRAAGGVVTPAQWLTTDRLAETYGTNTIKITTRQALELHGILKNNLKTTIAQINDALFDSIAACGDVNRNIMFNPNPATSTFHEEVFKIVQAMQDNLTPRTKAYHEIWLEKNLLTEIGDEEPIYGKTYLPRKFKIAFAIPPNNDIDIFANDLGFIAIEEKGKLLGFNISIGGGMGMTFGLTETHPQLGSVIGFIKTEDAIDAARIIVEIQRDNGNRENRKLSRLKYTVERLGTEWFKKEINNRFGSNKLVEAKAYSFLTNRDVFGWTKDIHNKWHYGLFIEGGRVVDKDGYHLKTALKEIAEMEGIDFRLTGNQNLIIGNLSESQKKILHSIFQKYKIKESHQLSGIRKGSLACVALNLCPLAFAEAERYLPSLIDKIDAIIEKNGLREEEINIRMTGCPNGCARPFLGEIGLIGKAPGKYNLYLGAGFSGEQLNSLYKELLDETQILKELEIIIHDYKTNREKNEKFGSFTRRAGYVKDNKFH